MGVPLFDSVCLGGGGAPPVLKAGPAAVPSPTNSTAAATVAHEGLLRYKSKGGEWKERYFVLDATDNALVKCRNLGDGPRERARSYGSVLGQGIHVAAVGVTPETTAAREGEHSGASPGFEVTTTAGQRVQFLTTTPAEALTWVQAMTRLAFGFTMGVTARLSDRELLAGKYALVRELGRGASGIVSLYTCQGRPYAIKKFVPQKAKGVPNRRAVPGAGAVPPGKRLSTHRRQEVPEDVRREIALLKKASRLPFVIHLDDVVFDEEQGSYFLVMEYMGGGAIAEWDPERKCYVSSRHTRSRSLHDERTVRQYATNLLLGVQSLHQNRLCHRDIKPENLMANDARTLCKIGDLGVAHYFREEGGVLKEEEDVEALELADVGDARGAAADVDTPPPSPSPVADSASTKRLKGMLKSTKGTYQFLPPEALSGDEFDGFKADIWAIGVTLYALSFGYLPFYSPDLVQLFEKIERDPVVFPTTCLDEELKDLLGRILEKDPDKRLTIEEILAHPWLHRNVDSRALQQQVTALKRAPALCVEEVELHGAVSVLQRRFEVMSSAVREDKLAEFSSDEATSTAQQGPKGKAADEAFVPRPLCTDAVILEPWMVEDLEVLAAQLHFAWCEAKHLTGWTHSELRDDAALKHPCLVPMRDLGTEAQMQNVRCVEETLKCVLALGCRVTRIKSPRPRGRRPSRERSSSAPQTPLPTSQLVLSWDMLLLVDLLAENSHEVWADGYIRAGWRFGPTFDAEARTHPSLRPYMRLDEAEKQLCRDGIATVLKSCLALGYAISCARK